MTKKNIKSLYYSDGTPIFENVDSGYPGGFDTLGEGETFTALQTGNIYILLNPLFLYRRCRRSNNFSLLKRRTAREIQPQLFFKSKNIKKKG